MFVCVCVFVCVCEWGRGVGAWGVGFKSIPPATTFWSLRVWGEGGGRGI